jgi:Fe-S cluster biogenesis protein NfuA
MIVTGDSQDLSRLSLHIVMIEETEVQKQAQQIESLIREAEALADPDLRARTVALVRSLMDFHAAGLERLMEIIADSGDPGRALFDGFARDNLVANLLMLYGLHPLDFETRVRQALDKVRPSLNARGVSIELLGSADGVVRLRLHESPHASRSSLLAHKATIEGAILEAAPDVIGIQVEGAAARQTPVSFVPLTRLRDKNGASRS